MGVFAPKQIRKYRRYSRIECIASARGSGSRGIPTIFVTSLTLGHDSPCGISCLVAHYLP